MSVQRLCQLSSQGEEPARFASSRGAADGEEGLRLAREIRPMVITLDIMMPVMDGWSVLEQLQADVELAHIPVLVLTILDEKNKGYALGAAEFVTKPINRDRLRGMGSSGFEFS